MADKRGKTWENSVDRVIGILYTRIVNDADMNFIEKCTGLTKEKIKELKQNMN